MSQRVQLKRKSITLGPKGKTILLNKGKKERTVPIIEDGKDVTPKPLNPDLFTSGKERQLSLFEASASERTDPFSSGSTSTYIFKSKSTFRTDPEKSGFSSSIFKDSIHADNCFMSNLLIDEAEEKVESSLDETFRTNSEELDLPEDMSKVPKHISLSLNETNTFILLDIPSSTALKDSDEGNIIEEQNQQYEFLTVGKGRNRKVLHAEVQTVTVLKKSRCTNPDRIKQHTSGAFASNWEMYDTYQETKEESSEEMTDSDMSEMEIHKLDEMSSLDSYRISLDEKQWTKLLKSPKFLEAVCVMERLLANNCYNKQQKRFIGLLDPSEFRENIEYKYNLNLLWTFANSETKGRSVNAMHWNPLNKDLLAVGYGKFYFADTLTGVVYIWNIKNPVQPERQYNFPRSVTALNFSKSDPNLLAVGFYNGYVVVLNIVSREKMIIGENTSTFEPVRDITWRTSQYELNNKEQVCAAFDDGRVIAYSIARKLEGQEIMRVPKADGKLKGYDSMGQCSSLSIPVSRYAAAFFVTLHPAQDTIYFIGTNKGVIHKCSTNYFNQHLDHFLAHDGPVYVMKFSPFSKKIYATCGDDWHTRIWAEDGTENNYCAGYVPRTPLNYIRTIRGSHFILSAAPDIDRFRPYLDSSVCHRTKFQPSLYLKPVDASYGRYVVTSKINGIYFVSCSYDILMSPNKDETCLCLEQLTKCDGTHTHCQLMAKNAIGSYDDIYEPLLELYTSMQSVQGLDWSPTHSTILVTILGPRILIWDFQRKVYEPQSTTHSPTGTKNTIVQFTDSGRCLVVGDIDGHVHVFSLEDMPFPAFFQENLLFESLFKALTTNPQLSHKLRKLQKTMPGTE